MLLFVLSYAGAKASHLAGGELRYEYNGTNYKVYFTMYGDCSGISLPNTVPVTVASASKNLSASLTLTRTSIEPVSLPCPTMTKCQNPSALFPGFRLAIYEATTNLPNVTSSDWVFSTTLSARNSSVNLATSGNLYVEAKLDNSNGHNSNAYIPNLPAFYISTSSTATTAPIQTLDPDGDSIVYERIAPRLNASVNAGYSSGGFGPTTPFGNGSTYTINATAQTMNLQGSIQGNHALAFRVKEYRNGNLVGSFVRDFNVVVLASSSSSVLATYPMISPNSVTTVYTCPGSTDSAFTWFTDPNSADSVFTTVMPPTITGWTFNSNSVDGKPTAFATAWWTAATNLNPVTLPYFFIKVRVTDNGCPKVLTDYAILVKTRQCSADSVWPGDANSDNVVNLLDPLAVALAYNDVGPSRPNASNNWVAQYAPDWSGNIPFSSVNKKHADCDGDSLVDIADLVPIVANYGLTHPKSGGARQKTTGDPEIYFDINGINFAPGTTVAVPIKMGTSASPMKDIYGVAARVKVTTTDPANQATITTATSWMGNSTNTLTFNKDISKGVVDWAYARIDHSNVSGDGTIATLNFMIPNNANDGDKINLSFENPILIDKDGKPITAFNIYDTVATIAIPQSVAGIASAITSAMIVPNPSDGMAHLHIELAKQEPVHIQVLDITGKVVWHKDYNGSEGKNQIELPAAQAKGVYIVHIAQQDGSAYKIKWINK